MNEFILRLTLSRCTIYYLVLHNTIVDTIFRTITTALTYNTFHEYVLFFIMYIYSVFRLFKKPFHNKFMEKTFNSALMSYFIRVQLLKNLQWTQSYVNSCKI